MSGSLPFRKRFSRHIVQLGACRLDFVSIHIVFKNVSMLLCYLLVSVFHHQVSCLASVVLHVEQLFAVSSFVVQHVFVTFGTYHPATCFAAVETCFGDDIVLVGSLWITLFCYLRNDFPVVLSGFSAPVQSQIVAKKSTPLLMSCGSFSPACFLPGRVTIRGIFTTSSYKADFGSSGGRLFRLHDRWRR